MMKGRINVLRLWVECSSLEPFIVHLYGDFFLLYWWVEKASGSLLD